ncbi:MAG: hypothetical protein ACKVPX_00220 [Myxococcaceae bacterium]
MAGVSEPGPIASLLQSARQNPDVAEANARLSGRLNEISRRAAELKEKTSILGHPMAPFALGLGAGFLLARSATLQKLLSEELTKALGNAVQNALKPGG